MKRVFRNPPFIHHPVITPRVGHAPTIGSNIGGNNQANTTNIAIREIVIEYMFGYLGGNYQDDYLSSRANGLNNLLLSSATPYNQPYNCSHMMEVWNRAKCYNLGVSRPPETFFDDFFDFGLHEAKDIRNLPPSLTQCSVAPNYTDFKDEAFNQNAEPQVLRENDEIIQG